jgi:hypothetical protein
MKRAMNPQKLEARLKRERDGWEIIVNDHDEVFEFSFFDLPEFGWLDPKDHPELRKRLENLARKKLNG